MPRVDAGGSSIRWLAAMLVNVELKEIIGLAGKLFSRIQIGTEPWRDLRGGAPAATRFEANRAPNWGIVDAASA
jgi:hypothetical protein